MRNRTLSASFGAIGLFSFSFLFALSAAAQPGVSYTSTVSGTPLSWSATSTWVGEVVPPAGSDVTIATNAYVTLAGDVEVGEITIATSGTLVLGSHTLTVNDYMVVVGTVDAGTSTVIFDSNIAQNTSQQTVDGTEPGVTLHNVQIPTGAYVDFGEGDASGGTPEPNAAVTITNELSLDGGAVVVNPPYYGPASTLKYNSSYTVSTEWAGDLTNAAAKGVPHHVEVATGATLEFDASTMDYLCSGDFTIDGSGTLDMGTMDGDLTAASLTVTGATGSMDMSGMTGDVIVNGDCTIGGVASQSVTLTLPSTEGKGKLDVKGDLTLGASTNNALTIIGNEINIECGGDMAVHAASLVFSSLKFDGNLAQTLSGQTITVDSLVVDNSLNDVVDDSDVTFDSNVDIPPTGVFNPVQGSVQIDGTFTMNSDATGTARIATLADAGATSDVTGDITFERYVPAHADGPSWVTVGNYVVGATRGDWNNSFGDELHLVFSFDEDHAVDYTDASGGANAWDMITDDTAILEDSDFGYIVYMTQTSNPTITAAGGYNTASVTTTTLTKSTGSNQGGGWHLMTNPFPSPIDGAALINDNSIFSSYQQYDNATGNFILSNSSGASTIDVGQSFWVQVESAGAIDFNTTQLTHGTNSFVRESDPLEEGFIAIEVSQSDGRYGETFLQFHDSSNQDWDWEMDASFKNSADWKKPEVYTALEDGHALLLNSIGSIEEVQTVNLIVESGFEGTVSLAMSEDYELPVGVCAVFEDLETGNVAALGGEPLVVELDILTTYSDRFVINFMSAPVFEATASHCEGGVLHFNGENAELWDVSWDLIGGELSGEGCVTGLETGDYEVEAIDPFTQCEVHANVAISDVCMGDFNLNGERDITDLLVLLVGIQPVDNFEGTFPETDCDCDGSMTTLDLLLFLPQFGSGCE